MEIEGFIKGKKSLIDNVLSNKQVEITYLK